VDKIVFDCLSLEAEPDFSSTLDVRSLTVAARILGIFKLCLILLLLHPSRDRQGADK
jgi:hypothetical protein